MSVGDDKATLLMTILNEGAHGDALVAVQVQGGSATVRPRPSPIPAQGITVYGVNTSQTEDPDEVVLRGPVVDAGYIVQLTLTFRYAAPVEVGALVMPHRGPYRSVPTPVVA
ncbi:hypothetical protein [Kribbella deserti]|uniref:Copper chaperone PCu(A)C n=1 Tax=Kribbella deserti TaxID=1926257 RepID=A0ABV6QFF9_9ACTN